MRIISIIIILIPSITYGQIDDAEIAKNIQNSTKNYETLFLGQNFIELSSYASPKLIEYLKSKQDFIYLLTELIKNTESQGINIMDISFEKNSEIIEHENELQCVVPFKLLLENEQNLVEINSGIALITFDKGQTWYFTFQVIKDRLENNKVLGLNENINIPPRTQNVTAK